jgi:GT2 family glycosyltransferase/tetratricopeptide (TPR) repeat protein
VNRQRIEKNDLIDYSNKTTQFIDLTNTASKLMYQENYDYVSDNSIEIPSYECSIIIPVFNKVNYTKRCIQSIYANPPKSSFEIIIINDASSDDTKIYLEGLKGEIRTITNKVNRGYTIACNQGAKIAKGNYILFLNNDTEVTPGWLDALVDTFKNNPDAGIVGSKLVYPDWRLQEAGGIVFSDGSGWNYGRFCSPNHPKFEYLRRVDYISGAALMIRIDLLKKLNFFDERYSPGYYEDTDLCFGIRSLGYSVIYCPFSTVIHHEGISSGTDLSKGMKRFQQINKIKFHEKWSAILENQFPPSSVNVTRASEHGCNGNILIIDPFLPMFDRASGSLRLFTIIKLLRKRNYHVTFIARDGMGQDAYKQILQKMGVEVYSTDPDMLNLLGRNSNCEPLNHSEILSDRKYDVAYISFYSVALQYLPIIKEFSPETKIVIDSVDIHFIREMREAELLNNESLIKRSLEIKKDELHIYSQADAIVTVTKKDWNHIRKDLPDQQHFIIPNIHEISTDAPPINNRSGLVFVGNFSHTPNIDAVVYFVNEIFPLVKKSIPNITLTIVGNKPPNKIRKLSSKNIKITGYVPSTVPYLNVARVSIAPLRYGAGMKGKIGEAMANGLPVVTTSVGAEGMGLINGSTSFIADDPECFAKYIVSLYENDDVWSEISQRGKEFIEQNYSPTVADNLLENLLQTFIKKPIDCVFSSEYGNNLVSIIILSWNQLSYTKDCVRSIIDNTSEKYEIVFVDNGSTDGTVTWLRDLVGQYSNFVLIENKTNLGFSEGCNQGIKAAKGQYVLLLNNDVIVTPQWLSGMLECLKSADDIGIVGPMTNNISGPQQLSNTTYSQIADLPSFSKMFRQFNRNRRIIQNRIVGFCMLFRRSLIEKIGNFDTSFGTGNFEDDDFCLRAVLHGYRNAIAGDVFIHHFGSQSFIGNKIDYASLINANRNLFNTKWNSDTHLKEYGKKLHVINSIQSSKIEFEKGFIDKCVNSLLMEIKRFPEELDLIFQLVSMLIEVSRYDEAYELLMAIPATFKNSTYFVHYGYCLEGLQLYSEAETIAGRLCLTPSTKAIGLNLFGIIAFRRGEHGKAQSFFKEAIGADPGYAEPYANLGIIKWENDRKYESINHFKKSVILSPTTTSNVQLYHSAVKTTGMYDDAIKVLKEAKDIHKYNKAISTYYMDILVELGQLDKALNEIERHLYLIGIDELTLAAGLEIRRKAGLYQKKYDSSLKRKTLSLCIVIHENEDCLIETLFNLKPLVDEIIVVLVTGQNSQSRNVAEVFGARIYVHQPKGKTNEIWLETASKASSEYVFFLEGSEYISQSDMAILHNFISESSRDLAASFIVSNNIPKYPDFDFFHLDKQKPKNITKSKINNFHQIRLFPKFLVNKINMSKKYTTIQSALTSMKAPIKKSSITILRHNKSNSFDLTLWGKAVTSYERDSHSEAKNYLKALLAQNPDNIKAYQLLFDILLNAGKMEDLREFLYTLSNRSNNTAEMYALIGNSYEAIGDLQKASDSCEQALSIDPVCARAMNLKGVIAYRNNNCTEAEQLFKKASQCDGTWGDPLTNLGTIYWHEGSIDKALEYYEKGFQISPTSPNVATIYHLAVCETGQYDRAKPVFEKALKRHPDFRKARLLLIDILIHLEANTAALDHIQTSMARFGFDNLFLHAAQGVCAKIEPRLIEPTPTPSLSLCMIVKNEEKYLPRCLESLKSMVDEIIVVDTGSTDATREVAEIFGARVFDYQWNDDFAAARNYSLDQASCDWILIMDADEVISERDHDRFLQLIKNSTSNNHAYMVITRNYTHEYNTLGWESNDGQYPMEEAASGWIPSEKVRLFPNNKSIRFEHPIHEVVGPSLDRNNIHIESCNVPIHHYGKLDIKREKKKDKHYYKIGIEKLKSSQNDPVAIRELAVQAVKLEKYTDAIKFWNRFVELQPNNADSHINMAYIYAKLKKYNKAQSSALKAIKIAPKQKEGHFNLGVCKLHLNKPQEAEDIFFKLTKKYRKYHSAVYMLAASQFCQGHIENGKKTLLALKEDKLWNELHLAFQHLIESLMAAGCNNSALNLAAGTEILGCSNEKIKQYSHQLRNKAA